MFSPVLAESFTVESGLVIAIVVGLVTGIPKLVAWMVTRYRSPQIPTAPDGAAHWTDVTGEIRPVLNQECAARHSRLAEELKNGSDKMEKLEDSIQEVKMVLIEMKQEISTGVELRIRSNASDVAAREVGRHEAMHHRKASVR